MSTGLEDATQRRTWTTRARGGRAPTIREVAHAAGVGIGTVSRALGSGVLVSPATRERVLAAARRVGYRPSRAAKVLRGAPTRVIGVMIPDLSLPLFAQWLRSAGEAARERGYVLLVCDGQNSLRVIDQQLERLYNEQVDGLLVASTIHGMPRLESFVEAGIPVVPEVAKNARRALRSQEFREASEKPATLVAFRHLVTLGHRRIAYFAYVERDMRYVPPMQRLRIRCLRQCIEEVGAAFDEGLVLKAESPEECRARLFEALRGRERPTAFIPGTEALTPAVLAGLADARLRIPEDASVVGFGDSLWEQAFRPPISVVRFDYFGVARAMVEGIVARIEGAKSPPSLPTFPSDFVSRGSCAPPPTARRRPSRRR
jgi:LacI family transcriptional regulator